jgi:hypothetical protein
MKSKADSTSGSPTKAPTDAKQAAGKKDLPHERDQSAQATGDAVRDDMRQAHRDIKRGLVDTDMRATPGLDAKRRHELVKDVKTPR